MAYCRFRLYLFGMWFYYSWVDGACLQYADGTIERGLQLLYSPVIFFLLCISVWYAIVVHVVAAWRPSPSFDLSLRVRY